jgi:DNA/RNA-binding domain of Phe-tRNA-synthetase-like protein
VNEGWIDPAVGVEFPGLRLAWCSVTAPVGERSPHEVRERLRQLSDRVRGSEALLLRTRPVPHAYRVFFRHVGIDPDERRTPIEAIALERMRAGGFKSQNVVDDALLLATLETGVPVLAFDAAAVEGELGLRVSPGGESLGDVPLGSGQVVIADRARPLAVLFGETAPGCGVQRTSERMLLAAVRVKGVPEVSVEEALWVAAETVSEE